MKIHSILCPTDFSEFSRRALEHAVTLARLHGAELTIVHVYPFMLVMGGDAPYFPSGLPLDASTRARLLSDLEAAAEPARVAGVKFNLLLLEGDPAAEILRRARTAPTDLIVVGTHGRRGFDRLILGSVAGRVVQKAHCAVLTVPQPPEGTRPAAAPAYESILCPVDLEGLPPIVEVAFSIARASRARVILLHVLEDPPQHEAAAQMAHIDWADFQESLAQDARDRLRQAAASQGAGGVVDDLVVSGKAYREILKTAEARGVSLIVMGIHGRNPLERMFFGSTTLHVLRQARCPVLTVRALDESPTK